MKLRNKKTGKIINSDELLTDKFILDLFSRDYDYFISKLHKIEDEWKDYEEPKEYWFIDYDGGIIPFSKMKDTATDKLMNQIGNYFATQEEAEKAVEKLRAWKVLKDMGFKIAGIRYRNNKNYVEWSIPQKVRDDYYAVSAFNDALHLLFGGEE